MTTVAVTGSTGAVGRALLERLDTDPSVGRIIGLDAEEPPMPVAKLLFRPADLRDRLLPVALDGADVVVHLGVGDAPERDEHESFARSVGGTRNVLAAAAKVGAAKVVHLSSAAVYGAHADNDLPLDETAALRANPDYPPAYQHLLAEELLAEFADGHPGIEVAVLRPATVLGPEVDNLLGRHLELPRLLWVRGYQPPLQFVHVDDVAAALQQAATGGLSGAANVASDGWLATGEVCTVAGKRGLEVPETVAFGAARALWARGLWHAPPGALHYLMHPWVVNASRLKTAGWSPGRSNREVLREFAADRHPWVRLGAARVRRRDLYAGALAGAGAVAGLAVAGRRLRRG